MTTVSLTNVFLAGLLRLYYINPYHSLKIVKCCPCFIGMKIGMWKVKIIMKSYLASLVITLILTMRLRFWKHLVARFLWESRDFFNSSRNPAPVAVLR